MSPFGASDRMAFIHVDVDSLWAIRRSYGGSEDPDGGDDPIWVEAVPRFLRLFDELDIKATFFVIGRDALVGRRAELIAEMVAAGHEVANHSFTHAIDLGLRSEAEQRDEIGLAQEAITSAAGVAPVGFRCPGYAMSQQLMRVVEEMGLRYDSSVLPTPWGGLLRAMTRRLSRGAEVCPLQFGSPLSGRAPRSPYVPGVGDYLRRADVSRSFCELPVSVTPFFRAPFHSSTLHVAGWPYFALCLWCHELFTLRLNFTLHAVDLLDTGLHPPLPSSVSRGAFGVDLARKQSTVRRALERVRRAHRIVRSDHWLASGEKRVCGC